MQGFQFFNESKKQEAFDLFSLENKQVNQENII